MRIQLPYMPKLSPLRVALILLAMVGFVRQVEAQTTSVPFNSGPIPLCDTSVFTANAPSMGILGPPWNQWMPGSVSLEALTINITSDHPQTLQILLTSPQGTTLLLSEFNGAGGQNYTNTTFEYSGSPVITTGTAPFTGSWTAQGGSFSVFDGEWIGGDWTITVIDTACTNGGGGNGILWTPGWFDGSGGNGGFTISFYVNPCQGWVPPGQAYICPGETVDILGYYNQMDPYYIYTVSLNGMPVTDPTAVSAVGTYDITATEQWGGGCMYWAYFDVQAGWPLNIGTDQVVNACSDAGLQDLTAVLQLNLTTTSWTLDGTPISS
ncbi:MAG TPA: proprotein convertase P-domain-containing protein, partial [Flavobacteriales bacterium]|nr:proprotein convertase P-domain-containing protein [Flavobacteriales bacterium]